MLEKQLIPSQAPSYGELQPPMLDFCRRAIALMRDEPARTAGPKFGPLADEIEAFIAQ